MFNEKKRLKLMSLIITASLCSGIYTSVECQQVLAATRDTSSYGQGFATVSQDSSSHENDNLAMTPTQIAKKDFQRDIPELKNVFKDYFPVGTCINPQQIDGSDAHTDFIKYQYNALVPGNFMKPDALQPTEGNFHWDDADKYVEFGQKNGMTL